MSLCGQEKSDQDRSCGKPQVQNHAEPLSVLNFDGGVDEMGFMEKYVTTQKLANIYLGSN